MKNLRLAPLQSLLAALRFCKTCLCLRVPSIKDSIGLSTGPNPCANSPCNFIHLSFTKTS